MKAILFADRLGTELQPLTQKTCVALLPIAAKPLIEYTLDCLLTTNIQQVIIVISAHADLVEHCLGNGERWGMQFDYVLSRGQEEPMTVLTRLGDTLTDSEYLLIRGDLLRSFQLPEFLAQASLQPSSVIATINGNHAGVCLLHRQTFSTLHSPLSTIEEGLSTLAMKGNISFLDSLRNYHQANLDVAAERYANLVVPGQVYHDNLRVGRRSKVREGNMGLVGAYCQVHPQAFLLDKVVLCNEVVVDHHAILQNTVVLPNSYIGPGIELRNAIVWGNLLIRIDTGAIVQVIDNFLLANLPTETLSKPLSSLVNRGLGLLSFLLSLPLWPLAAVIAYFQNPDAPLRTVKLRGNLIWRDSLGIAHPQDFITHEWATNFILLRHLPKLLAVISGQLRMVGVSPETPAEAATRIAAWETVRDSAPVGLIGPSQLTIPANAPTEERLLAEAYYARTRHLGTDIVWLLRGMAACFKING